MRLINADCTEVLKSFDDKSIDLIVTDPPYDLTKPEQDLIHNQLLRICKGTVIVFSPPENQWINPADQYGFWVKPTSTKNVSKNYSRFVEMIFFYKRGIWNVDRHWSQYTNIFTDLVDTVALHPYRKPPSLIRRLILNHSNPEDVVLDPFFGSGVVGEVCLQEFRTFVGIERNEVYFSSAKEKLQALDALYLPF